MPDVLGMQRRGEDKDAEERTKMQRCGDLFLMDTGRTDVPGPGPRFGRWLHMRPKFGRCLCVTTHEAEGPDGGCTGQAETQDATEAWTKVRTWTEVIKRATCRLSSIF